MAYMDQKKKAEIAQKLRECIPADWKYSLAVRHHSTIVLTLRSAPVDLLAGFQPAEGPRVTEARVNVHRPERGFEAKDQEPLRATIKAIVAALNHGNHDNSDVLTDHFDVGHYVDFTIGRWDKPFVVTAVEVEDEPERPAERQRG